MSTAEEMEAGRKRNEYFAKLGAGSPQLTVPAAPKTDGAAAGIPFPLGETIDTGIVTATVTMSDAETTNGEGPEKASDQIATFMERVVAWPGVDGAGFINLHWTSPKTGGWRGRPFKDVHDFMQLAQRLAGQPSVARDVYYCMTTQSQTGKMIQGYPTAKRVAENATFVKSLWLDIDIKPAPKGYPKLNEALDALTQFVKDANLPDPNALIHSGGGLHVYWINHSPITAEDWRPYAEGLKAEAIRLGLRCDHVCTADAARVLRVPGTFNRKLENNPRVVKLLALGDDGDFERDMSHLRELGKPIRTVTATVTKPPPFDLSAFVGKKPHPLLAHLDPKADNLADGLLHNDVPLSPDEVFKGCPHFQESFRQHGAGQSQGLWHLTVLATTWLERGREIAHTLSKGYSTYTREETDAMYNRKVRERAERGLGWPSCRAIESAGCKLCATCVHKAKIKSPLNLALPSTRAALDSTIGQVKEEKTLPVEAILTLLKQGADIETLLAAMNETYAVVRYGSEISIANIMGDEIIFMTEQDFHKMFANLNFVDPKTIPDNLRQIKERIERIGNNITSMRFEDFDKLFSDLIVIINKPVKVSRRWFNWDGRRCYLGRGVIFEPGGPLEMKHDMLNLWRGFGIEPKKGDWSHMRNHILNVVCSGKQQHFNYLIRWMAYAVQHPNKPIGVAVAFRGAPGAGKGVVARTLGSIFGKHFAHIANGEQLTGRFNASLATSCAVFLDEALWAGDKKGEGVLKALITEPRLQLEAKFRDPIMVDNRLRIMVASNEDWIVPAGIGDRRWFVLDVANTFAGTEHRDYFDPLYAEIKSGGASAMFHDLLAMDLSGFHVRAVPHTAAKAQQQAHSLHGTEAWVYQVLQEGAIGCESWQNTGLTVSTVFAYGCFEDFSKRQRDWRPDRKDLWSRKMRAMLGPCVSDTRPGKDRLRSFQFAPLSDCRRQFENHVSAPTIEWEPESETDYRVNVDQAVEMLNLASPGNHDVARSRSVVPPKQAPEP